ncbi:MAG: S-layer homology domain-containing protein, partial [Patescibacteria group bacterium]
SLVVLPVLAIAADSLEYLIDDADRFEEELDRMETEREWDASDAADMESADLIPDPGLATEDAGRAREALEEGMYVRIKIDGVPVDLTDVPKDTWFAPYVRSAADAGIVSGYRGENGLPLGLYGPADPVTIEQVAKIAFLASGAPMSDCGAELLNVAVEDRWSEEYFRCAEKLQWAVFSDGTVDPLRPATRDEVVVTMLQAFKVMIRDSEANPFTDLESSEFRAAIVTAYEDHVIGGYTDAEGNATGKFGPEDSVNRAEVAKIVVLAGDVYGN